MLKIKDDVDLRELKKYNIIPKYCCDPFTGEAEIEEYLVWYPNYMYITVADKNRNIEDIFYWIERQINPTVDQTFNDKKGCYKFLTNILYDLIKADLVENVGE